MIISIDLQLEGFKMMFCLLQIVTQYERAVILRLGRLSSKRAKGPGRYLQQSDNYVQKREKEESLMFLMSGCWDVLLTLLTS